MSVLIAALALAQAHKEPDYSFVANLQSGPFWAYPNDQDPLDLAVRLADKLGEAVAITQQGRLVCLVNPRVR